MAGSQGTVRLQRDDRRATFRVEGRPTMHLALALRRAAEQALAGGARVLHVDLRGCLYMDSTFLGTLLRLQRAARRDAQVQFALVEPSPECRALLQQVGIEDVFAVVPAAELPPAGWVELGGEPADLRAFQTNVCQAHQELAGVPGPVGKAFRGVADCLSRELEAQEAKEKAAAAERS